MTTTTNTAAIASAGLTVTDLMTDHPAWLAGDDATICRVVRSGDAVWHLACARTTEDTVRVHASLVRGSGPAPVVEVFDPAALTGEHPVVAALRQAGPIARLRNPDLWDALATAILRQVIRAGQARKLYRAFCHQHGEPVTTPRGTNWLFPTPHAVLALPDEEFARLGLAFKRRALRAAAEAYLDRGESWTTLPPTELLAGMQQVPRVGPWTAGAAVADLTNDFDLYPFADLAVRTWAARLVPDWTWADTEGEFADVWQAQAGPQLSAWTLLTLAYGVRHARRTGATAV